MRPKLALVLLYHDDGNPPILPVLMAFEGKSERYTENIDVISNVTEFSSE